jgi:hypothetical protein
MRRVGERENYTKLVYRRLSFTDDLPDRLFTLANLKNPRR